MKEFLTVERALAFILTAFSVFIFIQTSNFPRLSQQLEMLGPGFLPNLIAIIFIIFSVVLVFKKEQRPITLNFSSKENLNKILVFLYLVIYLLLMPYLGFLVSTSILLYVLLLVSGYRQKVKALGITLGTTTIIYVVFSVLLEISFPKGILM